MVGIQNVYLETYRIILIFFELDELAVGVFSYDRRRKIGMRLDRI